MSIPEKFLKPYDPTATEDATYKMWEDSGYFNPDNLPPVDGKERTESFSIVLPPPNVTGKLHLGHADMLAIEDSIVRFQRMRGKKALWIPGTDHAAIATQSKVEKNLAKEKIRKTDLGREKFLEKVNDFAMESQSTIIHQTKKMGSSLDWSRLAFTLDTERSFAVKTAFKQMYDDKIIYKDYKIINWDPKGQTVISDDEIVYQERKAMFYTFKYAADFPIAISTTRPETKVGDTAVAVHPDDTRYKDLIGNTYDLTFCGTELSIQIVADEHVDMEFGTGALGVTPAHSQADWDIAKRHDLPIKQVINEYAKMENVSEDLNGLKVSDARTAVVDWLKENNLLENEEEIDQNVSTAERTGGIIEPLPKVQWFIDVNKKFNLEHSEITGVSIEDSLSLKDLMRTVVESGQIHFLTERDKKNYLHWIDKLHDWAISRQIWYGHQIPVWYKGDDIYCGIEAPEGQGWVQDEDVLDTWFSSGLWTFSTLGWPHKTDDLQTYHPTDLIETGGDILFFWIARMILMSTYLTGQIPFKTVYIHGLVRDKQNRKLSKSLGNALDPLDMIQKYGTDALRMSLLAGVAPGQDVKFDEDKVRAYRKFSNKLWNVTRFILTSTEGFDPASFDVSTLTSYQRDKLAECNTLKAEITKEFEEYKLYLVTEKLYHYVWHELADKIIEEVKESVSSDTPDEKNQYLLTILLQDCLKLLHPFMPFITEEIWQSLPYKDTEMLMVATWPTVSE
jgi:valyl-tRNA synthetase